MTSGRLRAGLIIALIVVCSAIAGAALERTFMPHGGGNGRGGRGGGPPGGPGGGPGGRGSPEGDERRRASMLDRMTKSLELTPAQRAGIDSVMKTTDSSLHVIRQEMQPRLEQVFEASRTQIQARLTPEQREKFGKYGRGRGGPGGPRP
jgi:Spy/CpxP family protein refolding chaperone